MDSKKPKGSNLELLSKIVVKAGYEPKFEFVPWTRSLRMIKHGEADGLLSLYKTSERESFLIYPNRPLAYNKDLLISVSKNKIPSIVNFNQIKKYTIGVLSNTTYGKAFDELKLESNKYYSNSTEKRIFQKLLKNRYQLAIVAEASLSHFLKEMKVSKSKITIHPLIVSKNGLFYALSKIKPESKEIIKKLNAAHEKLITEDKVDIK